MIPLESAERRLARRVSGDIAKGFQGVAAAIASLVRSPVIKHALSTNKIYKAGRLKLYLKPSSCPGSCDSSASTLGSISSRRVIVSDGNNYESQLSLPDCRLGNYSVRQCSAPLMHLKDNSGWSGARR